MISFTPIIVEGPDGGGKTTLIKAIQSVTGREIAPRVVSKDTTAMVDLVEWVRQDNARPNNTDDLIYDRHRLISEPIYGVVMDRTATGFDSINWLGVQMAKFYRRNPLIIYCLPPKSEVISNIWGDEDNNAVFPRIVAIYNMYVARAAVDHALHGATIYDYLRGPQELERVLNLCQISRLRP